MLIALYRYCKSIGQRGCIFRAKLSRAKIDFEIFFRVEPTRSSPHLASYQPGFEKSKMIPYRSKEKLRIFFGFFFWIFSPYQVINLVNCWTT